MFFSTLTLLRRCFWTIGSKQKFHEDDVFSRAKPKGVSDLATAEARQGGQRTLRQEEKGSLEEGRKRFALESGNRKAVASKEKDREGSSDIDHTALDYYLP